MGLPEEEEALQSYTHETQLLCSVWGHCGSPTVYYTQLIV